MRYGIMVSVTRAHYRYTGTPINTKLLYLYLSTSLPLSLSLSLSLSFSFSFSFSLALGSPSLSVPMSLFKCPGDRSTGKSPSLVERENRFCSSTPPDNFLSLQLLLLYAFLHEFLNNCSIELDSEVRLNFAQKLQFFICLLIRWCDNADNVPHSTEYCRNMSEIFPIFYCNWNILSKIFFRYCKMLQVQLQKTWPFLNRRILWIFTVSF